MHEKVGLNKYLGDIISQDIKKNIQYIYIFKTVAIVNKISTCLYKRPYGGHTFRAATIMRKSLLLGSMLNNSESWINITKSDFNNLEKPATLLQETSLQTIDILVMFSCA